MIADAYLIHVDGFEPLPPWGERLQDDAAGVWLVDWLGGPFLTVAERPKPESLYRRFLDYRESLGMRVLPLTGGEKPPTAVLRDWLADGGASCLLVDRDLGGGGVPVSFFGRPASMPGGPALLAWCSARWLSPWRWAR